MQRLGKHVVPTRLPLPLAAPVVLRLGAVRLPLAALRLLVERRVPVVLPQLVDLRVPAVPPQAVRRRLDPQRADGRPPLDVQLEVRGPIRMRLRLSLAATR